MIAGIWLVVGVKYAPDSILIKIEAKGQVDLLGNAGTAETGIAFLHLDDGIDDCP